MDIRLLIYAADLKSDEMGPFLFLLCSKVEAIHAPPAKAFITG